MMTMRCCVAPRSLIRVLCLWFLPTSLLLADGQIDSDGQAEIAEQAVDSRNVLDNDSAHKKLRVQLEKLAISHAESRHEFELRLAKIDGSIQHQKTDVTQLESRIWHIHGAIVVIFGLALGHNLLKQVKENRIVAREIELQKSFLQQEKAKIVEDRAKLAKENKKTVRKLHREIDGELEKFQKILRLKEMIELGELDQNYVYVAARELGQDPQKYHAPLFSDLLGLDLDADVRDAVVFALQRAQQSGASSGSV